MADDAAAMASMAENEAAVEASPSADPVAEDSPPEEPVAEQPPPEEPTAAEPPSEESAGAEPPPEDAAVADPPPPDEPVAEEPPLAEPVAAEPPPEEPAAEEPPAGEAADNDENAAATKMQSAQRGKKARSDVKEKKAVAKDKTEAASATKVQSVQRGKNARADIKLRTSDNSSDEDLIAQAAREARDARVQAPLTAPGVSSRHQARHQSNYAAEERTSMMKPYRPYADGLADLFADLCTLCDRFVELIREWDDDENGTCDKREFSLAVPVLELDATHEEVAAVWEWLLGEHHRRTFNARKEWEFERTQYEESVLRGHKGSAAGPGPEVSDVPAEGDARFGEIEHWALFRLLVSLDESGDVEAMEEAARARLREIESRHGLGTSTFWSRDEGGKAKNRHALRKRKQAVQGWNHVADVGWTDTLNRGDGFDGDVAARVIQVCASPALSRPLPPSPALSRPLSPSLALSRPLSPSSSSRASSRASSRVGGSQ